MQEQGLPDGCIDTSQGSCRWISNFTPIDRSSNQPVVNRKNEGRHLKGSLFSEPLFFNPRYSYSF